MNFILIKIYLNEILYYNEGQKDFKDKISIHNEIQEAEKLNVFNLKKDYKYKNSKINK